MDEVFPILAGIALGLVMWRVNVGWLPSLFSLLVGAIASWISGELVVSAWYLVIDCVEVLIVAWITLIIANAYESRSLGLR